MNSLTNKRLTATSFSCPFVVRWGLLSILPVLAICLPHGGPAAADVIDFDDLTLTDESYWKGPVDSGTEEPGEFGGTVRTGTFASEGAQFINRHNLDFGSWSGFAYSNTTDNTTGGFGNESSAIPGGGYAGSSNYGVGFGYLENLDPTDITQLERLPYIDIRTGQSPQSARVTNTTYAGLTMRDGDAFSKKFGGADGSDPDFFRLNVYGSDASGAPLAGSVEFFLADFRFDEQSADYIVNDWALLDLSPLAEADRLYFNLASSDVGAFGMNTPAYFAIDSMVTIPEPASGVILLIGLVIGGAIAARQG